MDVLLRPKDELRNILSKWIDTKSLNTYAAMHVRRTDKSKEAEYIDVSEYIDYIQDYFDILIAQGLDIEEKKVKGASINYIDRILRSFTTLPTFVDKFTK